MTYFANFVMAHGAGQGMDSDFMQTCKTLFEERGVKCHLFNFDYMAKAIELDKKRPPDTMPKLISRFHNELEAFTDLPLFIGGKSMGGRVSTLILQESTALAAMCFGYPFHPPGKPEKLRTEHLLGLSKPVLVLQGERDPFGKRDEVQDYGLPEQITVRYITDGEHSFKPLKSSPVDWQQNMIDAVDSAASFIQNVMENRTQ